MTSSQTDRVNAASNSVAYKAPCRVATTANITLSGEQTIDAIAVVTGDRVLVKNQNTTTENGIYVCDTGTWTRAPDADGSGDVVNGTTVRINLGTTNGGTWYYCSTTGAIVMGTSANAWTVTNQGTSLSIPLPLAQGGTAGASAISGLASLGVIQVTAEGGTANAQTGTVDALVTAFRADQLFIHTPSVNNAGATTITYTPSGGVALAAKNVFAGGAACVGGEMVLGVPLLLHYDGVQLNIIGSAPFVDSRPLVVGSADQTKKVRLEVDGLTAGNTRVVTVPDRNITIGDLSPIISSLGSDVSLSNTGTFFDGPTIAQGTVGVWFVSGKVTLQSGGVGVDGMQAKLWDGTTVIDSARSDAPGANLFTTISLSGFITSPVGNLRISVKDISTTAGAIKFNASGLSKDSTITAIRVG